MEDLVGLAVALGRSKGRKGGKGMEGFRFGVSRGQVEW